MGSSGSQWFPVLATAVTLVALLAFPALAQQHPAVLAGHAILPALTLIDAPADAPGEPEDVGQVHGAGEPAGRPASQHPRDFLHL